MINKNKQKTWNIHVSRMILRELMNVLLDDKILLEDDLELVLEQNLEFL